jgi:hypothetical protein
MNVFKKDVNGKDIILDSTKNHQIMMEWEKNYMKDCIRRLNPFGDVLEIGFGLGYSAEEIQKFDINSYTLVESDLKTYEKALRWKKQYNHKIDIVFGRWENVYPKLKKFDCVFFDDYDIESVNKSKEDPNFLDRNIFFFTTITEKLKSKSKFSFYCALEEDTLNSYISDWKKYLQNTKNTISFEKYNTKIPNNCNYTEGKTLYIPLVATINNMNYG